jgi:hypothetical protein
MSCISFNGENKAIAMYDNHIKKAYKATLTEGIVTGLGVGSRLHILCCLLQLLSNLLVWCKVNNQQRIYRRADHQYDICDFNRFNVSSLIVNCRCHKL